MNPQVPKRTEGPKVAHRGPQEYQMGSKVTQGAHGNQKLPKDAQTVSKGHTEAQRYSKRSQYEPQGSHMGTRRPRGGQTGPEGPKWAKVVQNAPKGPRGVQRCPQGTRARRVSKVVKCTGMVFILDRFFICLKCNWWIFDHLYRLFGCQG